MLLARSARAARHLPLRLSGLLPACATRHSSVITGGGGGGGGSGASGGGTGKPFACPRCAVPLTKFWQQDQPLWGCIDCREIYSQRDGGGVGSRLPRSWSASRASMQSADSAASSAVAAEGAGSGDGARFSLGMLPPPATIKAELDKYVIGQDEVKRTLAVALYNHYKRVRIGGSSEVPRSSDWTGDGGAADGATSGTGRVNPSGGVHGEGHVHTAVCDGAAAAPPPGINSSSLVGLELELGEGLEMDKSNIMLVGPTGSGKTLLARTLARLVDVPFTMADATSLTQAGYVGEDVESVLHKLYMASGQNVEATQVPPRVGGRPLLWRWVGVAGGAHGVGVGWVGVAALNLGSDNSPFPAGLLSFLPPFPLSQLGIIYLDEIDKLARKADTIAQTRDVS